MLAVRAGQAGLQFGIGRKERLAGGGCLWKLPSLAGMAPLQEAVHVSVKDRREIERYQLREEQAADYAKPERAA